MTPHPDWQEILRAAHQDPIDPAHYTAVRARVIAEIERTHSPWRRLAWISGVAAAAAALLLLLLPMRRPELPPLPRVAMAPLGAAADLVAGVRPVAAPRPAPNLAPRPHRQPLTIKLQTSDPNIVIYWIAE